MDLSENEKKFRSYLKKYHPQKYLKLIEMEKEELFSGKIIPT
jgi:hypothetical protein